MIAVDIVVAALPLTMVVCVADLLVRNALFARRVRSRKRENALREERARLLAVLASRSMQRGPYR